MKVPTRLLAPIALCLVAGCSSPGPATKLNSSGERPNNPAAARTTNRILILSAGYYDPNKDTVGINQLTENVTQAFSEELRPKISAAKKIPINVNDKTTKYSVGEKLALYASKHDADSAVILSIDTPLTNGEYSIHLRVQYVDLRYVMKDGVPYSATPTNEIKRSYYLQGPQGDTSLSFEELADKFFADLKTAGRLQ